MLREFFHILSQPSQGTTTLRLVPNQPNINAPFVFITNDLSVEINMFKSTFLKVFKMGHDTFTKWMESKTIPAEPSEFLNLYYATVALLFTTPENHMLLTLHEDLVMQVLEQVNQEMHMEFSLIPHTFLTREIQMVQVMLSSNFNKANKSSSLWLLYKKLVLQQHIKFPNLRVDYIDTAFLSAEQHFSNYYCWSFVRWYANVFRVDILTRLWKFCQLHPSDSASWSCLVDITTGQLCDYSLQEASRLCPEFQPSHKVAQCSTDTVLNNVIEYIDKMIPQTEVPYITVRHLLMHTDVTTRTCMISRWLEGITTPPGSDYQSQSRCKQHALKRQSALWLQRYYNRTTSTSNFMEN